MIWERERGTRLCFPVLIEDLALNIDWDTRKELGFANGKSDYDDN